MTWSSGQDREQLGAGGVVHERGLAGAGARRYTGDTWGGDAGGRKMTCGFGPAVSLLLSHHPTIPACPMQKAGLVHYRTVAYYDTMTLCPYALCWEGEEGMTKNAGDAFDAVRRWGGGRASELGRTDWGTWR
ncbi:hypothetical protein ACFLTC_00560 [Chloroflexota bacterium]